MNALNKIIFRTAVEGLVWTVIAFCYGLGIFAMAFPTLMANFYDNVGNKRLSAMYHERAFERNPTNENLYRVLDKVILHQDHTKVIKYSKKMFELEDRDLDAFNKIINDVNAQKRALAGNNELILGFVNEDDRLRSAYIRSLVAKGQTDKANTVFERATDPDNIRPAHPSYAIFALGPNATQQQKDRFIKYYNNFEPIEGNVASQFFHRFAKDMFLEYFSGEDN